MNTPILTRVSVLCPRDLEEVLAKRSIGSEADCWSVVDTALYDGKICEAVQTLCDEMDAGDSRKPTPRHIYETNTVIEYDNTLCYVQVWRIGTKPTQGLEWAHNSTYEAFAYRLSDHDAL